MAGSKVRKNNRDVTNLTQRKTKKQAAAAAVEEDPVQSLQEYINSVEDGIKETQLATTQRIKFLVSCLFFVRVILSPLMAYTHHPEEVFSFMEPLNYTLRTFGKQISDYTPEFAARSWFVLLPFFSILNVFTILLQSRYVPIWILYYIVKVVLGYLLFRVENTLAVQLGTLFYGNICKIYLFLAICSVGLFNAGSEGVSYTLGLLFLTYSLTIFFKSCLYEIWIDPKVMMFSKVCLCIAMASIFGSPYIIVLVLPMMLFLVVEYKLLLSKNPGKDRHYNTIFTKVLSNTLKFTTVTVGIVAFIDSKLYSRNHYPLVNNVLFHIKTSFKDALENPSKDSIVGFYLSSLVLNFPVMVLLGLLGAFMFLVQWNVLQVIWPIIMQLFMWITMCLIMKTQSDLYLYPMYTHIVLIATFSIAYMYQLLKSYVSNQKVVKVLKYFTVAITIGGFVGRIYAGYINNSGSIQVYKKLHYLPRSTEINVLCVGDEYTSYPGAFFFPKNVRLGFVDAGYEMPIPRDFPEEFQGQTIYSWMDGIKVPSMTYEEDEDIRSIDRCDYFIQSGVENTNIAGMKEITCSLVIDDKKSSLLSTYFAFPYSTTVFEKLGLKEYYFTTYKEYCLYENSS